MTDSRCHLCEHDMEWYGHRCLQYFCSIDFNAKHRSGPIIGMQLVFNECISWEFHNCHGLARGPHWQSLCCLNALSKTENASCATVSSPIWGELSYKTQSCKVFNYPSSQVIGTGGFLVLPLSFTVTLWSNNCFLHSRTSPPQVKSQTCAFLPSGHIRRFKFYQLHSLMGEFGGKKEREEIKPRDYFPIHQHDFSDQSAWLLSNRGRILGFQSPT